jgi:hypothetical protein
MKLVIVIAAILFACGALVVLYERTIPLFEQPAAPDVIPPNGVFHKPLYADCPEGTKLLRRYFEEKDGSRVDACFNPKGDNSMDYLNPGESCCYAPEDGAKQKSLVE